MNIVVLRLSGFFHRFWLARAVSPAMLFKIWFCYLMSDTLPVNLHKVLQQYHSTNSKVEPGISECLHLANKTAYYTRVVAALTHAGQWKTRNIAGLLIVYITANNVYHCLQYKCAVTLAIPQLMAANTSMYM